MKNTVSLYDFREAFRQAGRYNNFTYEGYEKLFDFLEEFEQDTGTEMELDVIAICCDFTEDSIENHLDNYGLESIDDLRDNTLVIDVDDDNVIIQNY